MPDPMSDSGFKISTHFDLGTVGAELATMSAMDRASARVLYGTELSVSVQTQMEVSVGAAVRTYKSNQ